MACISSQCNTLFLSFFSSFTPQIKRRHEIEEKLERAVEVEKEVAIQERRELYQHRRAQQSKVARLENHMDTVQMVRCLAKTTYHASTLLHCA